MSDKVLVKKLVETFNKGDYICRQGDTGNDMYIIKSGKFEILKEMGDAELKLAELGPKDFFGEMALFGQSKRTASVRAVDKSEVVVVTKRMLETQFTRIPEWLVSMIKTIANRIVTTSKGVKVKHKVNIHLSIF